MAAVKPLTVLGVRQMLTRDHVDHEPLRITQQGDSVRIDKDPNDGGIRSKAAFWALFDRGISVAPYPEYDLWTRR